MRILGRVRDGGRTAIETARASALVNGARIRRWLQIAAMVVIAWSLLWSATWWRYAGYGPQVLLVSPAVVLLAWRLPERRTLVLALAAGALAIFATATPGLWFGLAALVYLAVVDDPAPLPWMGVTAAVVGTAIGQLTFFYPTAASVMGTLLGTILGFLVRALDRSRELEQEARRLQGQARWLEQRTGLARELHDVVGHHVTAMVVQAEAGLVGDPHHALREIGRLGRTTLGELDQLVVHLRDPDAELAVSAPPRLGDIDELLAAPLRLQGVDVRVEVDPDPGLDETGTLTVYRIAQEALTNIGRHAQARQVAVEVRRLDQHVRVRVSDDGVGLPAQIERGSGLVGIAERVGARGGVWELGARLGGGTILDVLLPVEAA